MGEEGLSGTSCRLAGRDSNSMVLFVLGILSDSYVEGVFLTGPTLP